MLLRYNQVTVITAASMSAICTNGRIKAGGIYFMISRNLGQFNWITFHSVSPGSQCLWTKLCTPTLMQCIGPVKGLGNIRPVCWQPLQVPPRNWLLERAQPWVEPEGGWIRLSVDRSQKITCQGFEGSNYDTSKVSLPKLFVTIPLIYICIWLFNLANFMYKMLLGIRHSCCTRRAILRDLTELTSGCISSQGRSLVGPSASCSSWPTPSPWPCTSSGSASRCWTVSSSSPTIPGSLSQG